MRHHPAGRLPKNMTNGKLYHALITTHGPTPRGVGWRDEAEQKRRFEVMFEGRQYGVSNILDVGCGYGALVQYLSNTRPNWFEHIEYWGVDKSYEALKYAWDHYERDQSTWAYKGRRHFLQGDITWLVKNSRLASGGFDMVVGSGILSYHEMPEQMQILDAMWAMTKGTMVFNMSTRGAYVGDLQFVLPRFGTDNWAIRHDYGLDEMTVTVKR